MRSHSDDVVELDLGLAFAQLLHPAGQRVQRQLGVSLEAAACDARTPVATGAAADDSHLSLKFVM